MSDHLTAHDDVAHSGPSKYVQIATVLFVLTALEVLLFEICFGDLKAGMPNIAFSIGPYFVEILLLLSAAKFWLVAMFYMHLKSDFRLLSWLFGFSLMLAFIVIVALFTLFTYNRSLWWWSGSW
ncbi:MAG TPA: cytochrome C oxidase subunit IV family protein [Gemmatimonadales bacterium]|jgi:hypothetical protein|nr:cytochrome C oxidase subunit IV family protein [Gemmatimonadales bacterium]